MGERGAEEGASSPWEGVGPQRGTKERVGIVNIGVAGDRAISGNGEWGEEVACVATKAEA